MKKLTEQDWNDVADLFDQCVALVEAAPSETNTKAARDYCAKRLVALSMFATGKMIKLVDA